MYKATLRLLGGSKVSATGAKLVMSHLAEQIGLARLTAMSQTRMHTHRHGIHTCIHHRIYLQLRHGDSVTDPSSQGRGKREI